MDNTVVKFAKIDEGEFLTLNLLNNIQMIPYMRFDII